MTSDFDTAVAFVLQHECEFAKGHYGDLNFVVAENVKGDPGGVTKYGIDQRDHPGLSVATLDLEGAKRVYHAQEWFWCNGDALPTEWTTIVFDACVNPGRRSLQWLQQVIGATVDGRIGPQTISYLIAAPKDSRSVFLDRCETYYTNLADEHATLRKFLPGWLNRNADRRALIA